MSENRAFKLNLPLMTMLILGIISLLLFPGCHQKESTPHDVADDTITLRDTTVVIYSSDEKFFLNTEYFVLMTDAERAALGFIVTRVGNSCYWADDEDGEDSGVTYTETETVIDLTLQKEKYSYKTMKCEILWKLGLGLQCSEKHLGYLRHWFRTDEKALSWLTEDMCPLIPETATNQSLFDRIDMTINGDTIAITAIVSFYQFSSGSGTRIQREAQFQLIDKSLKMLNYEDTVIETFDSSVHGSDDEYD
jgi:hypothetical protein